MLEYENSEEVMENVKSQNPEIKEHIELGDECAVVFVKKTTGKHTYLTSVYQGSSEYPSNSVAGL